VRIVAFIALLCVSAALWAADAPGFYLLKYAPGVNWDSKLGYEQQQGIQQHLQYLAVLHDDDIILMGGTLVGEPGAMMLLRASSFAQANRIAQNDPLVISNVLKAQVTGWRVRMSSMRQFERSVPEAHEPNQPFRIERLDPKSPINLKGDGTK